MAGFFIKKITLKNGSIRYRTTITHKSRNFKTKTFRLRRDASTWASAFVSDLDNFAITGKTRCEITFQQLAADYMHAWKGGDSSRATMVARFACLFDQTKIDQITVDDCRLALRPFEKLKPASYNKNKSVLVAVFDFEIRRAEDIGLTHLSENPAKKIRNKPVDNKRVRYLTDAEKPRLVAACRQIGGKFYLAFLLALSTGLRKANVLNLRWTDVDFKRGLVIIAKTKNGDPITAPVPQQVLDIMSEYRQIGSGFIFDSEVKPGVPSDFKKQWVRAREMAEIENFTWHDLRHDAASTLARDGRTLLEIAEILGHRSLQSTQRYAHLSVSHKQKIVNETMGSALDGLL